MYFDVRSCSSPLRRVQNTTGDQLDRVLKSQPVGSRLSMDLGDRVLRFGYATLLSPFEECWKNEPADRGISMGAGCSAGTVFVKSLMTT